MNLQDAAHVCHSEIQSLPVAETVSVPAQRRLSLKPASSKDICTTAILWLHIHHRPMEYTNIKVWDSLGSVTLGLHNIAMRKTLALLDFQWFYLKFELSTSRCWPRPDLALGIHAHETMKAHDISTRHDEFDDLGTSQGKAPHICFLVFWQVKRVLILLGVSSQIISFACQIWSSLTWTLFCRLGQSISRQETSSDYLVIYKFQKRVKTGWQHRRTGFGAAVERKTGFVFLLGLYSQYNNVHDHHEKIHSNFRKPLNY